MIRYFEVLGLFDEVEYFGFMDTSTDRIVELRGEQVFTDYADFKQCSEGMTWASRLDGLIPGRVKQAK